MRVGWFSLVRLHLTQKQKQAYVGGGRWGSWAAIRHGSLLGILGPQVSEVTIHVNHAELSLVVWAAFKTHLSRADGTLPATAQVEGVGADCLVGSL